MNQQVASAPGPLRALYAAHEGKVSDKWSIYLPVYEQVLAALVEASPSMLEIGVQNGGALEIWARCLPHARHIIGCDINPQCGNLSFEDPRISVVVGDASSEEAQAAIARLAPQLHFIVDDGSHTSHDIVRSFARYLPLLADGGIYVAEDLHCSYWQEFEGGLFHPASSMAFFKRLADVINHEHWGVPGTRADVLASFSRTYGVSFDEQTLARIHSVEFINSMCVIRKKAAPDNVLGPRIVRGRQALVYPEAASMDASVSDAPAQGHNPWSSLKALPEDEWSRLNQLNKALTQQLQTQQLEFQREFEALRREMQQQAQEMQNQATALAERERQLEAARAQYQRARARTRHLLLRARKLVNNLRERLAQTEQQHQECLNSLSWRWTAPLRTAARIVRTGTRHTR